MSMYQIGGAKGVCIGAAGNHGKIEETIDRHKTQQETQKVVFDRNLIDCLNLMG